MTYTRAIAALERRLQLAKGKQYLLLLRGMRVNNMEKEARYFLSSPVDIERISASTICTDSVFTTFLGIFFIKTYRHVVPIQLSTNEPEALKWLSQDVVNK